MDSITDDLLELQRAFGWLAHSRNARLRLFTEDTLICNTRSH
jgi:hypothetical protein